MNTTLSALYALQQVDNALAIVYRKFNAFDKGQPEQAAAETARVFHERVAKELQQTARDLKDAELELKTVDTSKEKYETKLYSGKVTNFKELEQIQLEVEALGRQRARIDERILLLMEQHEERKKSELEARKNKKSTEAVHIKKQAEYKIAVRKLALQIQALQSQRVERAAEIPAPLLKRYETIRAGKHGVGIGQIEDGGCGACHTQLPSNLITSIVKRDTVETCENCGRLLCAPG